MQVLQAKLQDEKYPGKYSKGLRNQNGEYLVNLCVKDIEDMDMRLAKASSD